MPKTLGEWFLCILGTTFVVIGVIGIVVPWLPHTPFFLIAVACYAKSSPILHKKILENRFIGPPITQWQKNKSIPKKAKVQAITMMTISFIIAVIMTDKIIPLIFLACLLLFISLFILSRPSE